MKYMGSKRRIAKEILALMLKDRQENQWYVEPFCGGCNTLDKVYGNRLASDSNKYLIALLKEMQRPDFALPFIGEYEYKNIQHNMSNYPEWLVGYAGFQLSFGAKWFGGYRRDKIGIRNYEEEARQNILAQRKLLNNVVFHCCNYWDLCIPNNSIIYCDPPYKNVTKYKEYFDHEKFWSWCEKMINEGHHVFVSEYAAPDKWSYVWSKEIRTMLDVTKYKNGTEKLFVLRRE